MGRNKVLSIATLKGKKFIPELKVFLKINSDIVLYYIIPYDITLQFWFHMDDTCKTFNKKKLFPASSSQIPTISKICILTFFTVLRGDTFTLPCKNV